MGPKKFLRKSNQRLDWIGPIFEALFCFLHAFYPVVAVLSARLPLLACRDAGAPFFLDFFCLSPVQFFPNWKRGNKLKLQLFSFGCHVPQTSLMLLLFLYFRQTSIKMWKVISLLVFVKSWIFVALLDCLTLFVTSAAVNDKIISFVIVTLFRKVRIFANWVTTTLANILTILCDTVYLKIILRKFYIFRCLIRENA